MGEWHVVFGTGPVGFAVMEGLNAKDKPVRMVNRSGKVREPVPQGVEVVSGDATDPQSTRKICRDAAVVYNCTNPRDYHKWPEQFPPLQAGVLEGAAAAQAKLVTMENLYMYGPTEGRPISEDTPHQARGRRGATRAAMTRELFEAHKSGKVRAVSGRASDFFGPRARLSALGDQVFGAAIKKKKAMMLVDIDQPHTYSYVPDIGKALILLGENDSALGRAWHIPSPPALTGREFLSRVYQAEGLTPKVSVMPKWLVRSAGAFVPPIRGISELFYEFDSPFVMDASRFVKAFGDIATPLDAAIAATLAWYRGQPA